MENPSIVVIDGGFYLFGNVLPLDTMPGFVCMTEAAMFGGFDGNKGMPGVARGDKDAKVTLDRFDPSKMNYYPLSACRGVLPCVDLYKFKGAVLR